MRENKDMLRARDGAVVLPIAMCLRDRARNDADCSVRFGADTRHRSVPDSSDAIRIEHLTPELLELADEFRIDIADFI